MNKDSRSKVYLKTKGLKRGLFSYSQEEILRSIPDFDKNSVRFLRKLFKNSSISTRFSVFEDLLNSEEGEFTFEKISILSTAERNNLYREIAPDMFYRAAKDLIADIKDFDNKLITHIVTASCTGCYSPGPGDELIKTLELERDVERIHLGFMGCYAGLAAIRVANSISRASEDAVVLIVCAELSSLHWRHDASDDNILSLSLFSDGAAAGIVSQHKFSKSLIIESCASELLPETEAEMAWHMGETGFEMTLSREVPFLLENSLLESVLQFLPLGVALENIDFWAVHPGGSKILKLLEEKFKIDQKIQTSWNILDQFGNMSSATILFVLEEVLRNAEVNSKVIGLAFGPGLTVEKAFLEVN